MPRMRKEQAADTGVRKAPAFTLPGCDLHPAPVPSRLYHRVALRRWACRSCAGDAPASWAAVRDGRQALSLTGRGWEGRIAGDPGLEDLLAEAAGACWEPAAGLPALALSTSKGDPAALQRGEFPRGFPGDLTPRLARRLGIGLHLPCPVAAACSTGLYALLAAADAIEEGRAACGLAGATDGLLPDWLHAGFAALGVLCGDKRPGTAGFQAATNGFAPAAGAGCLALATDGPWRLLAGVRLGDARHETRFSDPATLRHALDALWSVLPEPELIVCHATGTPAGDAYELAGLEAGPWRSAPRLACKPILGHTLGASGAIELALALEAPVRRLWKLSLGFGGHLAAVACQRM